MTEGEVAELYLRNKIIITCNTFKYLGIIIFCICGRSNLNITNKTGQRSCMVCVQNKTFFLKNYSQYLYYFGLSPSKYSSALLIHCFSCFLLLEYYLKFKSSYVLPKTYWQGMSNLQMCCRDATIMNCYTTPVATSSFCFFQILYYNKKKSFFNVLPYRTNFRWITPSQSKQTKL